MSEKLKIYITLLLVIPVLVTFFVGELARVPEGLIGIFYFLSLISTHLITSKVQEMLK